MSASLPPTPAALKAAREVAHAASYLASEAASLARAFEPYSATEESAVASEAAIRAARSAFDLDGLALRETDTKRTFEETLQHARRSLDAASEAVGAAKAAVTKASTMSATGSETGLGAS